MMAEANATAVVRDLKIRCGALGSALVSRDGVVLGADLPPGVSPETFAILCATILGAAATAAAELGRGPPARVIVEGRDASTVVVSAGPHALLVVVVGRDADLASVSAEIVAFANLTTLRLVPSA